MYRTEIRVKGMLNPSWSDWFGELQVQSTSSDETVFRGILPDLAALCGVISHLGSFVIPLISVTCYKESESLG
jgi:hypothetical protein